MRNRLTTWIAPAALVATVIAAAGGGGQSSSASGAARLDATLAVPPASQAAPKTQAPSQVQAAYRGPYPYRRVRDMLTGAVASGDPSAVAGAFNDAIYEDGVTMSESLPAIREFLTHPNPYVRLSAAKALYTAGDDRGFATLLELVRSGPIAFVEPTLASTGLSADAARLDIRVAAARLLAQYRQAGAADSILRLYQATTDGALVRPLAQLAVRADPSGSTQFSPKSAEYYGLVDAREFIPNLVSTFSQSTYPDVKVPAAWALAEMTGEDRYVQYLGEAARPAIEFKPVAGESRFDASSLAVKYLGSIQTPTAHKFLEAALESPHGAVVQYAVVNLLFNQPAGSDLARQVVLRELRREQTLLGATLLFQIASSVDDAEIAAAGEAFDRNGEGPWFRSAVERQHWPIYGWIDDYVVKLAAVPRRVRPERVFQGAAS
jgi:hypothetical protein